MKKTFEPIRAKQVLNRVQAANMPFQWSVNPYRGCAHGCSFCYARKTHAFLDLNTDDTFQHHILLKTNAPQVLREQLKRIYRRYAGDAFRTAEHIGVVAIGTATDPYQPIEAKGRLTQKCLRVLAEYRIPVTITTRSPLILRDVELLKRMVVTSVNISINTMDTTIWRRFEPASPPPVKRLEIVRTLVENGINAGFFLAPILPLFTDDEESLALICEKMKQAKARFVIPSLLRLAPEVKFWHFQTLKKHDPESLPRYAQLYKGTYPPPPYVDATMKRVNTFLREYGWGQHGSQDDWRKDWEASYRRHTQSEIKTEQLSFRF